MKKEINSSKESRVMSLKLSSERYEKIRKLAKENHLSLSDFVAWKCLDLIIHTKEMIVKTKAIVLDPDDDYTCLSCGVILSGDEYMINDNLCNKCHKESEDRLNDDNF